MGMWGMWGVRRGVTRVTAAARVVAAHPARDDALDVGGVLVEVDHPHPRHRRRRGELQVVRLEDEVDVRPELDALAARHRQQPVVVQHRIQRLDPFRIDVAVADHP